MQKKYRSILSSGNKQPGGNIGAPRRIVSNDIYPRGKQTKINVLYTRRPFKLTNRTAVSKQRNVCHDLKIKNFRSPCSIFSSIQKRDGRVNPYLTTYSVDKTSYVQTTNKFTKHIKLSVRKPSQYSDSHLIKRKVKSSAVLNFMPYIPRSRKVANSARRPFPGLASCRFFSKPGSFVAVNRGVIHSPRKCDTTEKKSCDLKSKDNTKRSPNPSKLVTMIKYILFILTVVAWSPCIVIMLWCWLITYPLRPRVEENEIKSDCPKKSIQRHVNKKTFNNNRLLCSLKDDTTKLSSLVFAQLNAMYSSFSYQKPSSANECKHVDDQKYSLRKGPAEDISKNASMMSNIQDKGQENDLADLSIRTQGKAKYMINEATSSTREERENKKEAEIRYSFPDTVGSSLIDLRAPIHSPLIYFTCNDFKKGRITDPLCIRDSVSADCFRKSLRRKHRCHSNKHSLSVGCSPRPAAPVELQPHICQHFTPDRGQQRRDHNQLCGKPCEHNPPSERRHICRHTSPCVPAQSKPRVQTPIPCKYPCGQPQVPIPCCAPPPQTICRSGVNYCPYRKCCRKCSRKCILKKKLKAAWKCICDFNCPPCMCSNSWCTCPENRICDSNPDNMNVQYNRWIYCCIKDNKCMPSLCIQLRRCCYGLVLVLATCVWCPIIIFFYVMCNLLCLVC